ncbi:hypothetical protein NHP21005_10100 [Helicobacter sp. NHP21005]|nr:hypothetical protein NHP21005_10100 [Helicobacter sp. NHP21005]
MIVCRGRNKHYPEEPGVKVDYRFDLFTPPKGKEGFRSAKGLHCFERLYARTYARKYTKTERTRGFFPRRDNACLKMVFNVYEDTKHSQITRLIGKIARATDFVLLEYNKIKPTAWEVWFFTLELKSGKQLARYSESLSKENLMRFQRFIYEIIEPKVETPEQGMFISSKEYLTLAQIKQEHQDLQDKYQALQAKLKEIEKDTTEFIDAVEEWLFFTQLTNPNPELEYLIRFCEKANPFMKKYFGTLIGLKEFGGQRAISYNTQELARLKREKEGFYTKDLLRKSESE